MRPSQAKYVATTLLIAAWWMAACSTPPGPVASPPASATLPQPAERQAAPAAPLPTASARATPAPSDTCSPLEVEVPPNITRPFDPPAVAVEDPSNHALDQLFQRLARLLRGRAKDHVRIAVYGDSNMTKDFITGEMRRTLQKQYGDAGHGYLAAGRPWSWYKHMDVVQWLEPKGWKSYAVSTHSVPDHGYGFGGIAAESTSIRARIRMSTAPAGGPVGTRVSRVQVFYLQRPDGAPFEVRVDGTRIATVQTASETMSTGVRWFEMEDGPHEIELKAGGPNVRLFGAALERSNPGIVVDSLGVGGAKVSLLERMNREIARTALEARKYDLVVILTGGTEDANEAHDQALEHFIKRHQEALPEASILIMSPIDFAYKGGAYPKPATRIGRLTGRKRRVALANGCAFWDFHAAMGGELSIVKFASHQMAWHDLVHLTESGGAFMGRRFVHALWSAFAKYAEEHPRAGCE